MTLIGLLILLVVLGLGLRWLNTLDIAPPIKQLVTAVVVIFCVILVLRAFGILPAVTSLQVPNLGGR